MREKPAYFESVHLKAAERCDQIEKDEEINSLRDLLFKQVQNPRNVLSELLQNADDAGATEASVWIENHVFIFEHNGHDFAEGDFASLCRFGYSNKRTLHTIGFRGIGFKSTFSLGDCVELFTPTLAIGFDRKRFTVPYWLSNGSITAGKTIIRVQISDEHRQHEVEKNLDEWRESPLSLLFFKNIRRMRLGDRSVGWDSLRLGPIPNSEWMVPYEQKDHPVLLIRSEAETFPEEAVVEIKQEHIFRVDEDLAFPDYKIEIVLGVKGQLFVVLPSAVETELPFACNAPFIQDPSRDAIKSPATSPTNRWMLQRTGQLAASAMLGWLGQAEMPAAERAAAYGLFPDVDRNNNSIGGVCSTIVEEAFAKAIGSRPLLLTHDGRLTGKKESVIVPRPVVDIWPADQAAALLDEKGRPALSQHVRAADRKKLLHWAVVEEIGKQDFLATLCSKHLPKPETWHQLLNLWAYVAPEITGYRANVGAKDVRIAPVQGKDVLYAATEVVRLGEKKLLQSEDDWAFLAKHLIVLNQNWPRFLAEQRRPAADQKAGSAPEPVEAAYAVLENMGLHGASDVSRVVERAAAMFFSEKSVGLKECVQLAQIAARLSATAGDSFRYATRDSRLRSTKVNILFDDDGRLEDLLPEQQRDTELLHPSYVSKYVSCSREDWLRWVASGKSGLRTFVPIVQVRSYSGRKDGLDDELRKRGFTDSILSWYSNPWFYLEDWDFEPAVWQHWLSAAKSNPSIWKAVAERILAEREIYWSSRASAQVVVEARNGYKRTAVDRGIAPKWALRLRDLPCLSDNRGFDRKPGELLRRTPETESLMDVEPFVHGRLDREQVRPLLDLLGVRSTPTGPDRLLDCLRALAKAENAPVHEVEKWYRRLDQMLDTCSTDDFQKVLRAFRSEKVVLIQDGSWTVASAVFLSSGEEDVPGAAVIRSSVGDLTLWRKIGIADRPTTDLAIKWLNELPSGEMLPAENSKRVRALLPRYPIRIWNDCGRWLNLAGEWVPTEGLSYALTTQSSIPWEHLHPWVKQKTADLRRLSEEVTSNLPFSNLSALSRHVEERFQRESLSTGQPEKKEWLTTLGDELRRVELDTEEETQRARALAERLAKTGWCSTPELEITPYIDGTPAGMPRRADVLWLGQMLYADRLPKAKLARRVPEEIGRAFERVDIKAALAYGFERSAEDVREYIELNFKLAPQESISETGKEAVATSHVEEESSSTEAIAKPGATVPFDGTKTEENHPVTMKVDETSVQEMENDSQQTEEDLEKKRARHPPELKPWKPSIIERFAVACGFRKDSDERFFRQDGGWIARAEGNRSLWELHSASGDLIRCYWAKDHCLEREPLQLEADIWGMIDQHPQTYAFILSDPDGQPMEVTGGSLREMRSAGKVTLYPAAYRLVYNHD